MPPAILNLSKIRFGYPGGPLVLDGLDFHLHAGDRIGLVAPNGSGKTTLFHIVMGLLTPLSGTIEAFGTLRQKESDFVEVRRRIGLLFQDADDQLFSPTVLEDVAFGPLNLGKSRDEALALARKTLAFLGLDDFEDRVTYKLSGGEKRLVSLATVLAMEPEVLLLDEPSTGLDATTKHKLVDILNTLELSVVLISHEFDFLSQTARHIYTMAGGRIRFDQELHIHTHQHAHLMGQQPHQHV
jgi:cobalt/nickel transport system ATP-binding protein